MPIYMDRHYMEGVTRHVLATAHSKDLETQGKYGVRFITYWFDEVRSTAFCLVEAPDKEAIQRAHDEAHGDVPSEIIEVDPAVVEAFLGRVTDPAPIKSGEPAPLDAGARAIMFTDLQDSTAMTMRLGDARALHLLHVHNALTRKALREHAGREVKHLGDGIMASFASIDQALECSIAIQRDLCRRASVAQFVVVQSKATSVLQVSAGDEIGSRSAASRLRLGLPTRLVRPVPIDGE